MAQSPRAERFRFLYRQAEGVINRGAWARASLPPVAIALLLTAIWLAIAPSGPRDLAREAFIDPIVVATHVYFLVYSFALILCAVAEYFVSAKRFADRGKPPALAGLAPSAASRRRGALVPAALGRGDAGRARLCFRRARAGDHRMERDRTRLRGQPKALMRRRKPYGYDIIAIIMRARPPAATMSCRVTPVEAY